MGCGLAYERPLIQTWLSSPRGVTPPLGGIRIQNVRRRSQYIRTSRPNSPLDVCNDNVEKTGIKVYKMLKKESKHIYRVYYDSFEQPVFLHGCREFESYHGKGYFDRKQFIQNTNPSFKWHKNEVNSFNDTRRDPR